MATDRQKNIFEMFGRTLVFNTEHAAEYAAIAAAAAQFAIVQSAYTALETFMAVQTSGEAAMAVEQKSILKAAIRRRLKQYSKTARALRFTKPGLNKAFEVPAHNSDNELLAKGRDFVTQATTHAADLAAYGLPASKATELSDLLDDLETAINAKSEAVGDTVGATAGIDAKIDDAMQAEIILDALMSNRCEGTDPVTHAEWKTARHVKRSGVAGEEAPGPEL